MNAVKWIAGASLAAAFTIGAIFVPGVGAEGASIDAAAVDGGMFSQGRARVMQIVQNGDGPAFAGENAFGRRGPAGKHQYMEAVAEQLGMTQEALRAELQASLDAGTPKSIADVAAQQGVALETISEAILEQMSEHLAEKVANGDLTQEEADERLAQASERIQERLTQPFDGQHRGRRGQRGHFLAAMSVVTEQLGMTPEELRAELQAGKSIADVAAEQGVALETISEAILEQMSEKLAEKVANGDLTQQEADERLAQASERISERLTQPFDGQGPAGNRGRHGQRGHLRAAMSVVSEQLGMTPEELRAELQAGKSIADVAAEPGVALETISDAILEQMSEKLAEKVANGDLTQEEADERLEEASQRIQEHLSQPGGQRGEGGRPGGARGQRGGQAPAFDGSDA